MSNYPQHQGGRASEVWGNSVRVAPYALLLPAPTPVQPAPIDAAEVHVEPDQDQQDVDRDYEVITDVDAAGGFSVRTWLVRWWFALSIRKKHR